jgi:hypothetical protein
MDIGEIFAPWIGMSGKIAHARTVDGAAIGKVAEGHAHGLDAILHRQQTLHVVVGNDDRHPLLLPCRVRAVYRQARERPVSTWLLLHGGAAPANATGAARHALTAHAVVTVAGVSSRRAFCYCSPHPEPKRGLP